MMFLSYHGDDIRKGFLSHLYREFARKQITMLDDLMIDTGHTIRPELVKVIRKSKISIVVFSKMYASSRWRLDELVEIYKCKETLGQTVMPVFFGVYPYEVKKQMRDFGKAFEETCKGETEEVKQRWRKALAHVAANAKENFQNWPTLGTVIEKIVVDISMIITIKPLSTYDVFPSFSGQDVRKGFLSHLRTHFSISRIRMFDDRKIRRGHTIRPELINAIRGSKVSIVVFSRNYASSKWCLDELVEIVERREYFGQIVKIIFYDVDPSDVRNQKGAFGKAFKKTCLGKTKKVKREWREALTYIADIAGIHYKKCDDESKMIQEFATDVSKELNVPCLMVSEVMLKLEAQINELESLGSDGHVKIFGIWGVEVGTTTGNLHARLQDLRGFRGNALQEIVEHGF